MVLDSLELVFKTIGASQAAKTISSIGKRMDYARKAFEKMSKPLQNIIRLWNRFKNILTYRVIKALIKGIADAFKTGMQNMYFYSKEMGTQFAKSMDMISTSMLYLKNSIGAMVAPIVNILAPVIDMMTDKFVDFLNVINQTIAKLSGASSWTKALKYPYSYADAMGKASKKAKELRATLLSIDEINRLDDNNKGSAGSGNDALDYSKMFEEVTEFAENGLDLSWISDSMAVFKEAWDEKGGEVVGSIRNAFEGVKDLISGIGDSLVKVFTKGAGKRALTTILSIFADINNIIGNITSGLANAWTESERGEGLVSALADIWQTILDTIRNITDSTAKWARKLNFKPLLDSFKKVFESLRPIIKEVGDLISWIWETLLLPIVKWVTEKVVPFINNVLAPALDVIAGVVSVIFGAVKSVIGWVIEHISPLWDGISKLFDGVVRGFERIKQMWESDYTQARIAGIREAFEKLGKVLGPYLELFVTGLAKVLEGIGYVVEGLLWFGGILAEFALTIFEVQTKIQNAWADIADWIEQNWYALEELASKVWNAIYDCVVTIWTGLHELFVEIFGPVIKYLAEAWNNIKTKAKEIWDGIYSAIKGPIEKVATWLSSAWTDAKNKAVEVWTAIKTKAEDVWTAISDKMKKPVSDVKTWMANRWTEISTAIQSVWGTLSSKAKEKWDGIKDSVVNAVIAIRDKIKAPINKIIGFFETMANYAIRAINVFIKGLNKLSFDMPEAFGGAHVGFNIPLLNEASIPRLERGGVVQNGQLFLANETSPEFIGNIGRTTAVANTSQMVDAIAGGVAMAETEGNMLLREQNTLLRALLSKETNIEITTSGLTSALRRGNQVAGRTLVPIGG